MKKLKKVTSGNYEELVVLSTKPVIINLCADWCHACTLVEQSLAVVNEQYEDYALILNLDVMSQPELKDMLEIDSLPLTIMMDGGVVTKKMPGVPTPEEFIKEMELETIKEYKEKGIYYHPKRNYIPEYIRNETW